MTIARRNQLSSVMKRAWEIIKNELKTKSVAMKQAWAEVKNNMKKTIENFLTVTTVETKAKETVANKQCVDPKQALFLYRRDTPERRQRLNEKLIAAINQDIANMTETYVFVGQTYDNKDAIKATGARWNPEAKYWVAPAGFTPDNFVHDAVSLVSMREILRRRLPSELHQIGRTMVDHTLEENNLGLNRVSCLWEKNNNRDTYFELMQLCFEAKINFYAQEDILEQLKNENDIDFLAGEEEIMSKMIEIIKNHAKAEIKDADLPEAARILVRTIIGK